MDAAFRSELCIVLGQNLTVSFPIFRAPVTAGRFNPGVSITFFGPHEGHDHLTLNAGVATQWTDRISSFIGYQGQSGRDNYQANGVTGTINISF